MKSVNKIRARDLNSDFLLEIFGSKNDGQLQKLLNGYFKKSDRIQEANMPANYTADLNTHFENIEEDIAGIKEQYRKNSTAIGLDDLTDDVTDILHGLSYFIQSVRDENGNALVAETETGQNAIRVADSAGTEHVVVLPDAYYERIEEEVSLHLMADRVQELHKRFNVLEETMKAVIKRIDGLPGPTPELPGLPYYPGGGYSGTVLASLASADYGISNALSDSGTDLTDINNFLYGDNELSLSYIRNKLSSLQTSVTSLAGKLNTNAGIKLDNLDPSIKTTLGSVSTLSQRVGTLEATKLTAPSFDKSGYFYVTHSSTTDTISVRMPVLRAKLCKNDSEVSSAQSTTEPYVVDCANGIIYNYNTVTQTYLSTTLSESVTYDNFFIMDTITNVIEYIVVEGALAKLNNGQSSAKAIGASTVSAHTYEIGSGKSKSVARLNNLQKYPPIVLVYDDGTSRTKNSYINSEGIITIAHHTDSFVIYNDIDKAIEVLVIMGD